VAAAAAAAENVAPLLQLKRAAAHAFNLGRLARAVELYERAVATAPRPRCRATRSSRQAASSMRRTYASSRALQLCTAAATR
jgi:hypothetical protein